MSSLRLNLPRGPLDVSDEGLDDDAALALLDQPTASERCRTNLSRLTRHARVAAKLKRWLRRAQMRLRVRAARRLQRWARSMAPPTMRPPAAATVRNSRIHAAVAPFVAALVQEGWPNSLARAQALRGGTRRPPRRHSSPSPHSRSCCSWPPRRGRPGQRSDAAALDAVVAVARANVPTGNGRLRSPSVKRSEVR